MGLEIEMNLEGMRERLQGRIDVAQTVMTQECKKYADDFTPMQSGALKNNFEYTRNENGAIDGWVYKEPYSRRQWRGITDEGNPFNYSMAVNDKARSRWTEHAAQNHKDDITRKVKEEFEK